MAQNENEEKGVSELLAEYVTNPSEEKARELIKLSPEMSYLEMGKVADTIANKNSSGWGKRDIKKQMKKEREEAERKKKEERAPDYEIESITEVVPEISTHYRRYIFHMNVDGEKHDIPMTTKQVMKPKEFKRRVFELTKRKIEIDSDEWDEFLNEDFEELINETKEEEPISEPNDVLEKVFRTIESIEEAEDKEAFLNRPRGYYYINEADEEEEGDELIISSSLIQRICHKTGRGVSPRKVREIADEYIIDNTRHMGKGIRGWVFSKERIEKVLGKELGDSDGETD